MRGQQAWGWWVSLALVCVLLGCGVALAQLVQQPPPAIGGLRSDGTSIIAQRYRVTTKNASGTLGTGDGPIVACTADGDVTLTLPAANTAQGHWTIVKVNPEAGACKVQRGGSDTINGGTATVDATAQWMRIDLDAASTTNWVSVLGILLVDLTTQVTDVLPVANGGTGSATPTRSIFIPAGSMDVSGSCAAIATAALVTNGPKLPTIGCTDNDADSIEFDFVMPDGWNASTITLELVAFSIGNNSTETFAMNFSGQCVRGGTDAVAAHTITSGATAESSSNVQALITWPNAANREEHATTAALTLNGTCAAGAHLYLHGLVDATATTMTPMSDLKILGVKIEYARNAND